MRYSTSNIGIDIGSVSVAVVEVAAGGEILHGACRMHGGHTTETLTRLLQEMALDRIAGLATTSSTPPLIRSTAQYDVRLAVIRAARHFYPTIGAILLVGGEKFGLIRFDADGQYHGFKANSACAAGTGSFLDQQARRLGLADSSALADLALKNKGAVPKIASRCAVFAKTDLIHAQQEGYCLAAICDGLCYGLAKNIVDTLFAGDVVLNPILIVGGVSKNQAVVAHLERLLGQPIAVHPHGHLFGALGAALRLADERPSHDPLHPTSVEDLLRNGTPAKSYHYDPLTLHLSDYPDFDAHASYLFTSGEHSASQVVEVDDYAGWNAKKDQKAYLGVDIGSTSTKAVLLTPAQAVLAGFYTRTAGRPLSALQSILSALDDWQSRKCVHLQILGAGTTGSGRKFIGRALGADLVLDEISAHARAACQLNPRVDTIIEIGGQDAKFTTLENGLVTSAVMNTVCAAGTGSFIEEQAQQLGCALADMNARTLHQRSPLVSDRCTVFMERDLHHYLSQGYSVDEVLAAVLHSIRENYLTKVAVAAKIGHTILFQGATAKNRALVAAFEQRLGKPIHVSRYCHLTGALGVALSLADQEVEKTQFRGIDRYKQPIPLQSEVCDFCPNRCKLSLMEIDGRKVAYGFLCGRDYDTPRYVHRNPSGFDLPRARQRAFAFKASTPPREKRTIGIPAALHLFEDTAMWQYFFHRLGIATVTSEAYPDAVRQGKHAAGAEFCAPMAALHGHVQHLLDRSDFIFLPFYLETRAGGKGLRRQYCYYTQYAAPLASALGDERQRRRFLMPLVYYLYNPFHTKAQLYRMLKIIDAGPVSFVAVSTTYDQALAFKRAALEKLKKQYAKAVGQGEDIHVVLLGRPYTVLAPSMNKGIPAILAGLGIKTFFQDMLSTDPKTSRVAAPLLQKLHWHYAAAILAAAETVAQTPGAYPVFVTAFKCSPDAFAIDYFKRVMGAYGKPYLVLQVDEHDAAGGYETRIEAALRAFRNHHARRAEAAPAPGPCATALVPITKHTLSGKTLLLSNWDCLSLPLVVAALQKEGIDARLLEESPASIQKSLRHNTGQCIPLNIIAQNVIEYIEKYNLNPAKTALWMVAANIACNIHLYPVHIRAALEAYGKGLENTGIYLGPISLQDISIKLPASTYFAYMFGGYLRRMGCRLRPRERIKGQTDRVTAESLALLVAAFQGHGDKEDALAQVIARFESIAVTPEQRPKVAILGDVYTRDNEVMNQGLIGCIEANGAEALTMPYSDYLKLIVKPYLRKWLIEGHYLAVLSTKLFSMGLKQQESVYHQYFQRILKEPEPVFDQAPEKIFSQYNLRAENTGESMENILKIHYLIGQHPDIALLVQTGPAFCCPALVTEAMARRIEKNTGVPMVSITYDGTGGNQNEAIIPYLHYARARSGADLRTASEVKPAL
jgi:predicted CoA-substrate-specific enzyme activase